MRRLDRIRHCMEQGALSHMDHLHLCTLMRTCRTWRGSALERRDGMQSFARWEWCFLYSKNYEANSALTKLYLGGNKVGDAGAVALAEALKATVVTCGHDFREGALVCF